MRSNLAKQSLILIVCAMLLCTGCSLFEPRDAELPDTDSSPWQTPSVPTAVFQNMRTGLQDLTGSNYERSLHSEFTYEPDPTTRSLVNDESKWLDYTDDVEKQVTQRMISEASALTVVLTNSPLTDTGTFAQFEGTYVLTITRLADGAVETFEGTARYDLIRGTEGWQLSKWQDLSWATSGNPTWGVLRARYRE